MVPHFPVSHFPFSHFQRPHHTNHNAFNVPYWLSGTNRQTVSNTHNHLDDGPPYITIHADTNADEQADRQIDMLKTIPAFGIAACNKTS